MITTGGQDSMVVQWKVTIDMLEETAALVSKTSTDVSSLMVPHILASLQGVLSVQNGCVVFDLVPILLASLQWMVPD